MLPQWGRIRDNSQPTGRGRGFGGMADGKTGGASLIFSVRRDHDRRTDGNDEKPNSFP
jgi:hypothetical protein